MTGDGSPPIDIPVPAPIDTVVVYPDRARVTRRGRGHLPTDRTSLFGKRSVRPGRYTVTLPDLPGELAADSVRVAVRGAVQIIGVDVAEQREARAGGPAVADIEAGIRDLRRRLAELADADDSEGARRAFLDTFARTGATALARSLPLEMAPVDREPAVARIGTFAKALIGEIDDVHANRRKIAKEKEDLEAELDFSFRLEHPRDISVTGWDE